MIGLEISSVKIELKVEPKSLAEMIRDRYREYIADGSAQYSVNVAWEPLEIAENRPNHTIDQAAGRYDHGIYVIASPSYSATIDQKSTRAELLFRSSRPLEDIEYFLRIVISHGLLGLGGFLFHSAGIVWEQQAYLFFGKSGSGKTTTARNAGKRLILSDDLVGVLPTDENVAAHSTPFWNRGWAQQAKTSALVAGFYRLVKSQTVTLEPMRESIAVSEILSCIPIVPQNEAYCAQLIPTIQNMIDKVGVHYLHLRQDDAYWDVLRLGAGS